MYLWPSGWNGSWWVEASMILSDFQLGMRPLCSKLLFRPVDYIFAICLTKCMSWLLGVKWRSWTSICFSTVISMLFYWYEDMVQLLVVTWALGLKKWLKSRSRWHITDKFSPWLLAGNPLRANFGFLMLSCLQHESDLGLSCPNVQWDPRESCLEYWIGSWESCSWYWMFVWCVSIGCTSLTWLRRSSHIIVTCHHMFTKAGRLLG